MLNTRAHRRISEYSKMKNKQGRCNKGAPFPAGIATALPSATLDERKIHECRDTLIIQPETKTRFSFRQTGVTIYSFRKQRDSCDCNLNLHLT